MAVLPPPGSFDFASDPDSDVAAAFLASLRTFVSQLPGGAERDALVISGGEVDPETSAFTVDTQSSDPTDDLDTILQTNLPEGSIICVSILDASRVVTLKASGGNLILRDGVDLVLDDPLDKVFFIRVGSSWEEIPTPRRRLDQVVDLDAAATLLNSDHGKIITNRGAAGDLEHDLPTPPAAGGVRFRVRVTDAHKVKLTATGGATIRDLATVSGANGYAEIAAVVGNYVELEALSATEWWVVAKQGSLAVV